MLGTQWTPAGNKHKCMSLLPEAECKISVEQTETELTTKHMSQLAVRGQQRRQAAQQAALWVRGAAMAGCCITAGVLRGIGKRQQPAEDQRLQKHLRQRLQGEIYDINRVWESPGICKSRCKSRITRQVHTSTSCALVRHGCGGAVQGACTVMGRHHRYYMDMRTWQMRARLRQPSTPASRASSLAPAALLPALAHAASPARAAFSAPSTAKKPPAGAPRVSSPVSQTAAGAEGGGAVVAVSSAAMCWTCARCRITVAAAARAALAPPWPASSVLAELSRPDGPSTASARRSAAGRWCASRSQPAGEAALAARSLRVLGLGFSLWSGLALEGAGSGGAQMRCGSASLLPASMASSTARCAASLACAAAGSAPARACHAFEQQRTSLAECLHCQSALPNEQGLQLSKGKPANRMPKGTQGRLGVPSTASEKGNRSCACKAAPWSAKAHSLAYSAARVRGSRGSAISASASASGERSSSSRCAHSRVVPVAAPCRARSWCSSSCVHPNSLNVRQPPEWPGACFRVPKRHLDSVAALAAARPQKHSVHKNSRPQDS